MPVRRRHSESRRSSTLTGARPVVTWIRSQSFCVTGARGALGRRVVRRLVASGAGRIIAFDVQPPSSDDPSALSPVIDQVTGTILNSDDLDRAVSGCSVVFHLAALVQVGGSELDPISYFEANGLGSARTFDACRRAGVERVVYASTSHVYGIPKRLPVPEDHPLAPQSPYAASKLAGENALQGFCAGFPMTGRVGRIGNIYGASGRVDTVTGSALSQAANEGRISLRNLSSVRDFTHADDVVEALIRLAAMDVDDGECVTVNISCGEGASVWDMAETVAEIVEESGNPRPQVNQSGQAIEEAVPELVLDNTSLAELTGWRPEISLEAGLRTAMHEFWPARMAGVVQR